MHQDMSFTLFQTHLPLYPKKLKHYRIFIPPSLSIQTGQKAIQPLLSCDTGKGGTEMTQGNVNIYFLPFLRDYFYTYIFLSTVTPFQTHLPRIQKNSK